VREPSCRGFLRSGKAKRRQLEPERSREVDTPLAGVSLPIRRAKAEGVRFCGLLCSSSKQKQNNARKGVSARRHENTSKAIPSRVRIQTQEKDCFLRLSRLFSRLIAKNNARKGVEQIDYRKLQSTEFPITTPIRT